MKLISGILKKHNKTIEEFVNYTCDDTRNHDLWKYKGQVMMKHKNGNQEKKLFVDERLLPVLDKFLNE